MKKLSILFVALFALFGFTLSPDAASAQKVMWGKTELKPGQIGKVTILKSTTLFKVEDGTSGPVTYDPVRELKPGEEYRVYGTKTIQGYAPLYDVGGGFYVVQSDGYGGRNIGHLKYETPSKAKLSLVNKK
ncbi:hypothetical protein KHA94_09135 [Bacillus sp. FJAT-49705]|uniref:Uncharacterized protein n=1 Tax=Cytobacillus citreus TaxID=2833586 RepID=A0ABS5NSD0_9BACI|nr:hypothetical protein [Cytobacillus citreus]MBS4190364.1 hypothetical protein [Cytobacillus citreus]